MRFLHFQLKESRKRSLQKYQLQVLFYKFKNFKTLKLLILTLRTWLGLIQSDWKNLAKHKMKEKMIWNFDDELLWNFSMKTAAQDLKLEETEEWFLFFLFMSSWLWWYWRLGSHDFFGCCWQKRKLFSPRYHTYYQEMSFLSSNHWAEDNHVHSQSFLVHQKRGCGGMSSGHSEPFFWLKPHYWIITNF